MKTLIALCGPIGAGKTTLARELCAGEHFHSISFAEPIRRMVATLIAYQNVPFQEAWHWVTEWKERPCKYLCGATARWAMQTLGTEWGRNLIHPDLWVNVWEYKVGRFDLVVTDDSRFTNEEDRVRSLGGKIIRVERPGVRTTHSHTSEHGGVLSDLTILNDGEPQDMVEKIRHLFPTPPKSTE